jgi:hypothetical protein
MGRGLNHAKRDEGAASSAPTDGPAGRAARGKEGGDEDRFNFNGTTAFVYACATCEEAAFFVDDRY